MQHNLGQHNPECDIIANTCSPLPNTCGLLPNTCSPLPNPIPGHYKKNNPAKLPHNKNNPFHDYKLEPPLPTQTHGDELTASPSPTWHGIPPHTHMAMS